MEKKIEELYIYTLFYQRAKKNKPGVSNYVKTTIILILKLHFLILNFTKPNSFSSFIIIVMFCRKLMLSIT